MFIFPLSKAFIELSAWTQGSPVSDHLALQSYSQGLSGVGWRLNLRGPVLHRALVDIHQLFPQRHKWIVLLVLAPYQILQNTSTQIWLFGESAVCTCQVGCCGFYERVPLVLSGKSGTLVLYYFILFMYFFESWSPNTLNNQCDFFQMF